MRLVIESQPYKIGIQTRNAKLDMKTTKPVLELKTEQAKVQIETTKPQIQIDQKQCFSESGLKGIFELNAENAASSVSEMYASVGRIAEQGNEMTRIESGGNAIADQAYYNAYEQFNKDFNMGTMPKSRPKISLIRGTVSLSVKGGTVSGNFKKGEVESNYSAGKVEIYALQQKEFKMRFEPTKIDQKV